MAQPVLSLYMDSTGSLLVVILGGDIQAPRRIGEGTEFTLYAVFDCVSDAQRQSEGAAAPQTVDLTGYHILLCEGHPLNREIARRMLSAKGAEVTVAEDGRQGVELFTTSPEAFYGAALMDIGMPVMDGYAAAGRNAHVAKPVDPAVLFAVLEK